MKHVNPYTAGNPVYGASRFVGRASMLHDVLQSLQMPDTKGVVVFGQRRIGKSSLLLHLQQVMQEEHAVIPIYVDLQYNAACAPQDVLYGIARKIAESVEMPLPQRAECDVQGRFFRTVFLPDVLKRIAPKGVVLLFDECGVLDRPRSQQCLPVFAYLHTWLQMKHGIQAVFAIGRHPEQLSSHTLRTFKAIRAMKMALMSPDECAAIIRQSEACTCLRWTPDAIRRVWYWTQGHPYFTQLLCSEVWETACVQHQTQGGCLGAIPLRRRTAADVDAAIEGVLEQGSHAFQWLWNDLTLSEQVVMSAVAGTSQDYISQEDFTAMLQDSQIHSMLQDSRFKPAMLLWWELLHPTDKGYRIAMPLLRRWITHERPLRRMQAILQATRERLADSLRQFACDPLQLIMTRSHALRGNAHSDALRRV